MISSLDASCASEPSERADPAHVCGGIACKSDEVIVSIDSGSDEHCLPLKNENLGRRLDQVPPVLSAVQGTEMQTTGISSIGYQWMSANDVPVEESRSDMVICDTKKFVFSTVKMRKSGMIIHHEEGNSWMKRVGADDSQKIALFDIGNSSYAKVKLKKHGLASNPVRGMTVAPI